jgi:hypothetical protein
MSITEKYAADPLSARRDGEWRQARCRFSADS